jgi:signal transduction histidine kinase
MHISRKTYLLLLIFSFTFCLLGLWNFSRRPTLPGKITYRSPAQILYSPTETDSPKKLLKVSGLAIQQQYQLEAVVEHHAIGDLLPLEFADYSTVNVRLIKRNSSGLIFLNFLLGFIFLTLATLVFWRCKEALALPFALSGLCFALILSISWSGMQLPVFISVVINVIYFFAYPQSFLLFYHFAKKFPSPMTETRGAIDRSVLLQILGFAFTLGLLYAFFRSYYTFSIASIDFYQHLYRYFRIYIFLVLFLSFYRIFRNMRRQSDPVNRRKGMWLLLGVFWGSFPFIFFWSLPQLWGNPLIQEWTVNLFVLLVPISLSIAILRYRLFDIEIVLSRSLTYSFLILLLVVGYLLLAGTLSLLLVRQFSFNSPYISVFAGVCIAFLFTPLRSRVQHAVDTRFFRIRYDRFHALQAFINEIAQYSQPEKVIHCLEEHFRKSVPLQWQQVVWKSQVTPYFGKGPLSTKQLEGLLQLSSEHPIANQNHVQKIEHEVTLTTSEMPSQAVIVISLQNHLAWIWGEKSSQSRFWKEDLDLGEEMARAALLQLQKIDYFQKALLESYRKEAAEKQNQWKSLLVAEVAHDLRAPLNTLLWKIKQIQEELERLPGVSPESFQEVEHHLNRMQDFIHNLLLLSRNHGKTPGVRFQPVSLNQTAIQVHDMLAGLLAQRGIHLENTIPDRYRILGDPYLLQEVLLNLLENSAKNSPRNSSIHITASREIRRNREKIAVRIGDQAGGIDPRVFRGGFSDMETMHQWQTEGRSFRLGLHIVREFVRLLRGEITVRSKPGQGSVFTLYFRPAPEISQPERSKP